MAGNINVDLNLAVSKLTVCYQILVYQYLILVLKTLIIHFISNHVFQIA